MCVAEREVFRLLDQYGRKGRKTRHGIMWYLPGKRTVLVIDPQRTRSTSVEPRFWKNTLAELRRVLKEEGIAV